MSLPEVPRRPLSRRTFLGVVGATAAGAAAASLVPSGAWALLPQEREGETRIVVRRRLDQMLVTVTFYGMTVDMRAGTITIDDDTPYRTAGGVPAGRIVVDFGPQAVLEEAHVYANVPHPQPPVRSRLAGPSRVALTVPQDLTLNLAAVVADPGPTSLRAASSPRPRLLTVAAAVALPPEPHSSSPRPSNRHCPPASPPLPAAPSARHPNSCSQFCCPGGSRTPGP